MIGSADPRAFARRAYVLTRDVTTEECEWLDRNYKKGEEVYEYTGCTYGCCTPSGMACSVDGETPFFELPRNALKPAPAPIY